MVDIQPLRRRSRGSVWLGHFGRFALTSLVIGFGSFVAIEAFAWITAHL